jgi:alginate O-acetyltransferase complex protein AlgI
MLFGTTTFLFVFLPLVLLLHLAAGPRLRNTVLLAFSLVFYAWGEQAFVLLMLASIGANYVFGLMVERARARGRGKGVVAVAIAFNLLLLIAFKYTNFLRDALAGAFAAIGLDAALVPELAPIHLPIGISFFTFQALTYVVDLYRGDARLQRNPFSFGLFISLFPQLIAGPIVRYSQIAEQLDERRLTLADFSWGVRRFIIGLSKKLLVADVVALAADEIFGIPATQLTAGVAWLGVLCYSLQIYFDFSGYSDMAIGLGSMLGFRFPENFRHPYVSQSITGFWRRWHITLSTWFRDYLYIPLGGGRGSLLRVARNLVTVFFLCGLWHGASWTFVVWGLYHGAFLILERVGGRRLLEAGPRLVRHLYVPLVVAVGWVFFRSPTLGGALSYLSTMFTGGAGSGLEYSVSFLLQPLLATAITVGLIGSMPVIPWLAERRAAAPRAGLEPVIDAGVTLALSGLLLLCLLQVSAQSYSPFIYFRF